MRPAGALGVGTRAGDRPEEPNVLVIWGDDIGTWNISLNNRRMMGYRTPNIDRIAKRGRQLHRLTAEITIAADYGACFGAAIDVSNDAEAICELARRPLSKPPDIRRL